MRAISRRCNDAGLATREIMAGRPAKTSHDLAAVQGLFDDLASARGPVRKQALLEKFFGGCSAVEASYVVRILTGDLRIGLKEGLLEEAIIGAFGAGPDDVRGAGMLLGDPGALAVGAKNGNLRQARLRVFHPVKCMLAGAEPDGEAVWNRLAGEEGAVWAEDKYDGIRAQLHLADGRCEIFSRDLRRITAQFPEIVEAAVKLEGSAVLDGEILASVAGRRLTFFDLQKRLNRREADLFLTEDVPVEFVAFDVLRHDGVTMLDRPWRERRAVLEKLTLEQTAVSRPGGAVGECGGGGGGIPCGAGARQRGAGVQGSREHLHAGKARVGVDQIEEGVRHAGCGGDRSGIRSWAAA